MFETANSIGRRAKIAQGGILTALRRNRVTPDGLVTMGLRPPILLFRLERVPGIVRLINNKS